MLKFYASLIVLMAMVAGFMLIISNMAIGPLQALGF